MRAAMDLGTVLARAIEGSARAAGCRVEAQTVGATRWASATFNGARYQLRLASPAGAAFDRWLAGLPERDFAIRGHLVADLATQAVRREAEAVEADLEILTLEDR